MEGKRAAVIAAAVGLWWWWAQSTVPTVGPQEACSIATKARNLANSADAADVHRAQLQIWDLKVEGSQEIREGIANLNTALVSLFEAKRVEVGSRQEPKTSDVTQAHQEVEIAFAELNQRCGSPSEL